MNDDERILAQIAPAAVRRVIAVGMLGGLGGLLIYLGFSAPDMSLTLRLTLFVPGIAALVMADRVRRATEFKIEMTDDLIRDTSGRLLCRLDDIVAIERSAFAFKPSNGFLIRTKQPIGRCWVPGLWWRFGRKIGVGGVTSAAEAKFMADLVALHLRGDLHKLHPRS